MNGENGRVQTFNQLVRSLITMAFSAGFVYGFIVAGTISAEVFTNLVVLAVTWWFSRDQAKAAAKETVEALKTPPTPEAPR